MLVGNVRDLCFCCVWNYQNHIRLWLVPKHHEVLISGFRIDRQSGRDKKLSWKLTDNPPWAHCNPLEGTRSVSLRTRPVALPGERRIHNWHHCICWLERRWGSQMHVKYSDKCPCSHINVLSVKSGLWCIVVAITGCRQILLSPWSLLEAHLLSMCFDRWDYEEPAHYSDGIIVLCARVFLFERWLAAYSCIVSIITQPDVAWSLSQRRTHWHTDRGRRRDLSSPCNFPSEMYERGHEGSLKWNVWDARDKDGDGSLCTKSDLGWCCIYGIHYYGNCRILSMSCSFFKRCT